MAFKFQFPLQVLNLLGRGLYRNFATVIAEAVSNAWDAEATRVDIIIDGENKKMTVKDDGKGMDDPDFQDKFLRVGYTRREDPSNTSTRKVLGRKGIGKLALLSVSEKVTITTRKNGGKIVSALIDNAELDEKIKNDDEYVLQSIDATDEIFKKGQSGTCIEFENIKPIMNRPELIRMYMAVIFNFSFSFGNEKFEIYVNGDKVTVRDLDKINSSTELLWKMNCPENKIVERFGRLAESYELDENLLMFESQGRAFKIMGYIASVYKPTDLTIRGVSDFRAGVHLFSNGRLRQEDILRDVASSKMVQSYLYGEIHVDALDEGDDIFTSAREGLLRDNPIYNDLLKNLRKIQRFVIKSWDQYRIAKKHEQVSDELDGMRPKKAKAIKKLLATKEDEDWQKNFSKVFLPSVLPKRSHKRILICHSSKDKVCADKVYEGLLSRGVKPSEIIYSSSINPESKLPNNVNIFKYIREFFVQDWRINPHVLFIVSEDMEQSWHPSLEAGAAWIVNNKQNLFVKEGHSPKRPLKTGFLYVVFDENGNFLDSADADKILDEVAAKGGKS